MRPGFWFSFLLITGSYTRGYPQPPVDLGNIQVTVTFETTPAIFTVTTAPLRYNKTFALSFQLDDGNKDIYTHGFPFLEGGKISDTLYPGLKFTDGCGNDLNFKMSSSIYSFTEKEGKLIDAHDPGSAYASINVTWPQLTEMYRKDWGISNHGLTSGISPNPSEDIAENHRYIKNIMTSGTPGGPEMAIFVNPSGNESYTLPAISQGYLICFREGAKFGKPSLNVAGKWDHQRIEMGRTNLYREVNLSAMVDAMAAASVNGEHHWGVVFSHSITNSAYGYTFTTFKNHMRHIAATYGKAGRDNLWMATEEEIVDYLLLKDTLKIHTRLKGKVLDVSFTGSIPSNLRFYNITLLINSDANISSVNCANVSKFSWCGKGIPSAMINFSKFK